MPDYRGAHEAPSDGAPLHDLTAGGVWPDDVHTRPELYFHDPVHDAAGYAVAALVRDRPDQLVTIYRAVPAGVGSINPGDWVTLSHAYARQHAMHPSDPDLDDTVLAATVPARHIVSDGNSLSEWGYCGPPVAVLPADAPAT